MDIEKEMPKELIEAMDRVIAKGKMELSSLLDDILNVKSQKEKLIATRIFANKELDASEKQGESSGVIEMNELTAKIDELHGALVNHKLVKDTLQKAALNIQMQETVNRSMQKMEAENTVDHFPEKGYLLSQYSSNLDTCKSLVSAVQEKEELEKDILEHRIKYIQLLRSIKDKWEAIEDSTFVTPNDSEVVELFKNKLKERESKLQILISILQCVISTSGFLWGAENYYIQVLLLCDIASTNGNSVELEAAVAEINRYHQQMKGGSEKKRKKQIYFTSTPDQRKE